MSRGLYYKKKLFRIFLFLLAFILLSHLPLYADDAVSSEPIGEVEVTAKPIESDTIPEKPTSFGSIINLEKERVRFIELRDILDSEAGLHVRRFGGTGSLSTVEIRGVSSKGILVMIDGVPLNGLWATGVDLSTIPLSGFEKIEVLRGGGGAFYGDSALGGAINLLTSKEKTAINHTTASVGSFGLIQNKSLFMSRCGNEDVLVALEGSGSMGDFEFANDNGTSLDRSDDFPDRRRNNESESFGSLIKCSVKSGDNSRLSVTGEFFRSRKGVPGLVTFPSQHARQVDRRVFIQAVMERDEISPRTQGDMRVFFRRDGLDYEDKLGEGTGVGVDSHRNDDLFGINAGLTRIDVDGLGLLNVGFELSDERYNSKEEKSLGRSKGSFSVERERVFFENKLTVHGVGRVDAVEGFNPRGNIRIGASYQASGNIEWRANAGTSFRVPGFDELYDQRGFVVGNPNLVPEKGMDFDLGLIYSLGGSKFSLSIFNNYLRDQVVYEMTSGHRFKPFNVGKSDLKGVEISMDKKLGDFSLFGNYTYLDARNRGDDPSSRGKKLPSKPDHEVFAGFKWEQKPLTIEMDLNYLSGNYVTFANTSRLKSRITADFIGTYRKKNWAYSVEIRNLSDENITDIRGFPLPGRAFIISISHDF